MTERFNNFLKFNLFMVKCNECEKKIEETFFGKIKGTFEKGKVICSACQKKKSNK
jgi:hypothetical protein